MRKNRFLAALLASSALASPALAADMTPLLKAPQKAAVVPISGYLEMEAGFAWNDNNGTNVGYDAGYSGTDTKWLFNGAGRVNWWVGPSLSTQFDVWGGVDSFGRGRGECCGPSTSGSNHGVIANTNLGAHFSYRIPEQYLIGLFGAIGGIGSNANCCNGGAAFTHGTLGLEGQWYSGPITLYGQGGVQTNLSNGDQGGDYTAWFVRVVGRYFLNENLRLEAFGMYAQGRASSSEDFAPTRFISNDADRFDMKHFVWGASIEKKLDGSPLALFARYEGSWTEFRTSFDAGYNPSFGFVGDQGNQGHTFENLFKVGFRLYLNEQTLKYNDRMGTTLDIRDPFTSAYRAFGRSWIQNFCNRCNSG